LLCGDKIEKVLSYPPPSYSGVIQDNVRGVEIAMRVPGADDAEVVGEAARKRQERELQELDHAIARAEGLLGNEQYRAKAPAEVIAKSEAKLAEMKDRRTSLCARLGVP
jgi:valyl-tRNA synthetase